MMVTIYHRQVNIFGEHAPKLSVHFVSTLIRSYGNERTSILPASYRHTQIRHRYVRIRTADSVHRHEARQVETDLQKHVTVSSTSMESDVSMAEYLRTFLFPNPNIGTRARRYQGGRWAWGIKQERRGREEEG